MPFRCFLPDLVHFVFCVYQDYALGPVMLLASLSMLTSSCGQMQVRIVDLKPVLVLSPTDGGKRLDQQAFNGQCSANIVPKQFS
jgi:hypothetical protein